MMGTFIAFSIFLASLPLVHGGGGDAESWHPKDYELSYVEAIVLIILVVLALCFEITWHSFEHRAEDSYHYGKLHELESGEGGVSNPRSYGRGKHVRLEKELMKRIGSEFMTLGFLAFNVFLFNQLGGFKRVTKMFPSNDRDNWHLPYSAYDWLHVVENVHMKLFVGMVLYFVLMGRIVSGSVGQIKQWEELRLRFQKEMERDADRRFSSDPALKKHAALRDYFIHEIAVWKETKPELFHQVAQSLHINDSIDMRELFVEHAQRRFALGAYLALNVESGVHDMVEVHTSAWSALMLIFGVLAVVHRVRKVPILDVTLYALIPLLIIILTTRIVVYNFENKLEAMSTNTPRQKPKIRCTWFRRYIMCHKPAVFIIRSLQAALFFISYIFARTALDFEGWKAHPQQTALLSLLFALLHAFLARFFPTHLPMFLALMAVPPFADRHNTSTFFQALIEDQLDIPDSDPEGETHALREKVQALAQRVDELLTSGARDTELTTRVEKLEESWRQMGNDTSETSI